jgi:hypothetical protein
MCDIVIFPEVFETVESTHFGEEDVDEDVAVVHAYPLGVLLSFDGDGFLA